MSEIPGTSTQIVDKHILFLSEQMPQGVAVRSMQINSLDDIQMLETQIQLIISGVTEGNACYCIFVKPKQELIVKVYKALPVELTKFTLLPTGIENVAEHEEEHAKAAYKILSNQSILTSKYGIKPTFSYGFRILVYPNFQNINRERYVIPVVNLSVVLNYDEFTSLDDKLIISAYTIIGAQSSRDGLSPSDKIQLKQIRDLCDDSTPNTKAFLSYHQID